MKKILLIVMMFGMTVPALARTDGGGAKQQAQKYNNPSGKENCYYCWKDLNTQYTPSRHKYAKKS